MLKSECRVGMVVEMSGGCKGVVVKNNPINAQIKTLSPYRGSPAGTTWRCPYSMLNPVVGEHSAVVMKSFEQPNNDGIKKYMESHLEADEEIGKLDRVDELIVRAICEIYSRIDDTKGRERYGLSAKINSLFTALGREVSQRAAEDWIKVADGR